MRFGGEIKPRPCPVDPKDAPFVIRESDDDRGHAFVIHWKTPVQFDDGLPPKKTLWFKDTRSDRWRPLGKQPGHTSGTF